MPAKKVFSLILPASTLQKVKRYLLRSAFPMEQKNNANSIHINGDGVNLVGYARAEMGIGESCRIAANSLDAAKVPFGIINFVGTNSARMSDLTWIHKEIEKPAHDINLFHINAEQMMEIYATYGNTIFNDRYNIGYWHWELPDFPDQWIESFTFVDEIWAPSTFVADAISIKSPVPVVKIPHSINVKIEQQRDRSYYELPEDSFIFLTMYDINSFSARKNPQASINAFKKAFKKDNLDVGLVVKVNVKNADSKEMKDLHELIGDYNNIYLIKEVLSRNDVNALINIVDSYISLHRSEGFGLGLAEAMFLGKPVIGTNWSSNTDFMTKDNSCLVNYTLINLEHTYGPYESYQYWADPDVEHAASYMEKLFNNKVYRDQIARAGEETIKNQFSSEKVGALIRKRMDYITKWKNGG